MGNGRWAVGDGHFDVRRARGAEWRGEREMEGGMFVRVYV